MQQRLPKFRRAPEAVRHGALTERDLDIIATIERYRLIPTSLLIQLVPGNEDVTYRRLQRLYHRQIINRFSFPRVVGPPGEFNYFLDNRAALEQLMVHRKLPEEALDWDTVRRNHEKPYSDLQVNTPGDGAFGRLLFVEHELMISRFHGMLELACQRSGGAVDLAVWRQGADLHNTVEVDRIAYDAERDRWYSNEGTEKLPHRPDAFFTLRFPKAARGTDGLHFFYEADRKRTTDTKRIRRKFRAHFAFVVRQRDLLQRAYGVSRVRAVLIETLDSRWAQRLREISCHPSVCGPKPTPLFWFTTSEVFTRLLQVPNRLRGVPCSLAQPEVVLKSIWLTPLDNEPRSILHH